MSPTSRRLVRPATECQHFWEETPFLADTCLTILKHSRVGKCRHRRFTRCITERNSVPHTPCSRYVQRCQSPGTITRWKKVRREKACNDRVLFSTMRNRSTSPFVPQPNIVVFTRRIYRRRRLLFAVILEKKSLILVDFWVSNALLSDKTKNTPICFTTVVDFYLHLRSSNRKTVNIDESSM